VNELVAWGEDTRPQGWECGSSWPALFCGPELAIPGQNKLYFEYVCCRTDGSAGQIVY